MNLSVNKTTATHTYLKLRFLSTRKIKVFPASTQKCGDTYGPTGDKIHTRNVNDTANHHLKNYRMHHPSSTQHESKVFVGDTNTN